MTLIASHDSITFYLKFQQFNEFFFTYSFNNHVYSTYNFLILEKMPL